MGREWGGFGESYLEVVYLLASFSIFLPPFIFSYYSFLLF